MKFDPSPEAMGANGQIWFPTDYNRIRWWAVYGSSAVIRPALPASASSDLGLKDDVFWTYAAHLTREEGNSVYADWLVARPDLGLAVMASRLEVAVTSYYDRLLMNAPEPLEVPLRTAMGAEAARSMRDQFSSREPRFVLLSDTGRAPVVLGIDDDLERMVPVAENVLPMKRSVYDPAWREQHGERGALTPGPPV